jgi:hypothetical protein
MGGSGGGQPPHYGSAHMTPENCPNCGADVPARAKACPECGADENTGWSEEAYASGLNLPGESFDYDEFIKRELGGKKSPVPHGQKWYWWVAAIAITLALVIGLFYLAR